MAKIPCPCGRVISTVMFPSEEGRKMLTEVESDNLFGERYLHQGLTFWECSACGRLLFLTDNDTITSYKKEAP